MSFPLQENTAGAVPPEARGLHVPGGQGQTVWFAGDVYTVKLTADATRGSLGLIEASVPPGGGPPPHLHVKSDATFYLTAGELEFLEGDRIFVARAGDAVFIPRGVAHRFTNIGLVPATMVFLYTPGGPEGLFIEGGDEPRPGVQVEPWGPERLDAHLMSLLGKYDNEVSPPEA